ncbi:MAG: hypothetical protein PUB21_12235 [Bacteroidales bacterium]|nr:hypothetical protein [Bacteroidales bacterium]
MKVQYWIVFFVLSLSGCQEYYPKPKAVLRAEKSNDIVAVDTLLFANFETMRTTQISPQKKNGDEIWINIVYPEYQAELYGTYCPVKKNKLTVLTNDFYELLERNVRDEEFHYSLYESPADSVYAHLFLIGSSAASPIQFFVTDSVSRFFRGALYFAEPSLSDEKKASYTELLTEEVMHLLETFRWK